jgi:hypothetical protein
MITHDRGDAEPPANKTPRILEWASKRPGEPTTTKTIMLPAGMIAPKNMARNNSFRRAGIRAED